MDKYMNGAHGEKAKQLFMEGYNCSQAVLGAFCEECGMDFETAMKISSSFGGGMEGSKRRKDYSPGELD